MVIDLRATFGKMYLVKMDESYAVEKRDIRESDEKWFQEVQGKYGAVYPYSESEIAVAFENTRAGKKKRDAFLADVGTKACILQNADDRTVYGVPNDLSAKGIKAIKGWRTRQLSVKYSPVSRHYSV